MKAPTTVKVLAIAAISSLSLSAFSASTDVYQVMVTNATAARCNFTQKKIFLW